MAHSVFSALMLRAIRHPWTTILAAVTLGYLSFYWSDQIILTRPFSGSNLTKPSTLITPQSSASYQSTQSSRAHLTPLKKRAGSNSADPQGQNYGTNQGPTSLYNLNNMQNNNYLNNNNMQNSNEPQVNSYGKNTKNLGSNTNYNNNLGNNSPQVNSYVQNTNNLGSNPNYNNKLGNNNYLPNNNNFQNSNTLTSQHNSQNNNNLGNNRNNGLPSFGQFPPLDHQCKAMPMEAATWKTLQMDDYMQKIPDGNTMSLEAFAVKMNYTNFICGIGASCWAGQPCYPLGLRDFYILYSVQQYNTYMNVYADAVGYGIGLVQSTINALIASLFPAQDTTMIKNMKANMGVQAAFSQVTGAVLLDLFTALTAATGPIGMAFNVLGQVIVAGMATAAVVIQEPPGPLKDGFDQWSNVAYYLTQHQQMLRKQIDDTLKKRIQSGISTEEGMFGAIKGGAFLPPAQMISLPDFTDRVRNITTAMGINLILNRSNAFITVGSGCQEKGENGASEDPSRISYCRKPGGTMYNLFISHGDDAFWQIENGQVIRESFGYSPELIIMSSVRCQKLNRGYRYSPWADGKSTPKDVTDTCVFNLPVCYLDHKDTRDRISRDHKRFSPGKACKMEGMPLM